MKRIRHDYIELSLVYITAVGTLLFLSTVATPISISHFGVIAPLSQEEQKVSSMYNMESFMNIEVNAKAYVIYDIVDKKILASKNETTVLPLASLTKIMTAITALSHHDAKKPITISSAEIENGYDLGLKKNQVWTLEELLKYTLVFSSNDGAAIIANALGGRKAFVDQMNNDATLLGLSLYFNDPAGLDNGSILGGQGSAIQVAKLFAVARKRFPYVLDATTHNRATVTANTGKIRGIPNTNQRVEELLGAEASKTGFTDSAGGNLAVVVDITVGHPIVIVVLGSTHSGRFEDIEKLFKALKKSIQN